VADDSDAPKPKPPSLNDLYRELDRLRDELEKSERARERLKRENERLKKELAAAHPRAVWPRHVQAGLQEALAVRDRVTAGEISEHGAAVVRGHLLSRILNLLGPPGCLLEFQRLAAHLTLESQPSSAFSSITRSTPRAGAPSKRFGRPSSIERCPMVIARRAVPPPNRS